ncbi:hypothetical protein GCM10010862_42490 [Devosia nitrariae]|uniref:Uncharacterized protein n=1 Tax=Devosia nitrariae TaxID=2071872 RepID=A0ABQ5WA56_9HYPH|nr:hypothetical protein GCM10010862_42490 [Devosia nitrariae]
MHKERLRALCSRCRIDARFRSAISPTLSPTVKGTPVVGVKRPAPDFTYARPETVIQPGDLLCHESGRTVRGAGVKRSSSGAAAGNVEMPPGETGRRKEEIN